MLSQGSTILRERLPEKQPCLFGVTPIALRRLDNYGGVMNPFKHGVTVTGKDFCPRPELIADLRNHIDSRQNCVIRGVRRVGKTSAIIEAVRSYKKKGHIYINCWGKQDIHSLTTAIYEGFLIYQRNKGLSLEKIIRTFAHLRPKASIDPYSSPHLKR